MQIKTWLFFVLLGFSFKSFAAIGPSQYSQMVNLNIKIKGESKIVNSDITLPFYQNAELEKKVGSKNYLFVVNPKKGKNPDEVEILVKLFNKNGTRVVSKKEVLTKLNKETVVSIKGLMFKFTPTI